MGGPLSWRKPVTFGLSFGVTTLTVAWIATFLGLSRRAGWLLLGTFGVALALRVGLVLLLVGQALGGAIIANGTAIDRPPTEVDLAILGAAGSLKIPHAAALHAVQVLPLLAWLLSFTVWAEGRRVGVVATGAAGYGFLVAASAVQTFSGLAPFELSVAGALLGLAGLVMVAGCFVVTLVALWGVGNLRPVPAEQR